MTSRISIPRVLAILAFWGFSFMTYSFGVAQRTPQLRATVYHAEYRSSSGELVTPPLKPHGTVIGGTELFYMLPKTAARGVLMFFHGCNHGGQDLFELPEDRIVALAALNRGLAVLSMTSKNRDSGCWNSKDVDALESNNVVDKWMSSVELPPNLPRMGMGASSGGAFLFKSYKALKFKSMASYVIGTGFKEADLDDGSAIPTVFVHMPKDTRRAGSIVEKHKALVRAGVPTKVLEVHPHPLTPELCARRLPELGDRRCQSFIRDVMASRKELLNKNDMSVMASTKNGEWASLMKASKLDEDLVTSKTKPGQLSQVSFGGHSWLWASMEEEIAVSYAVHEMSAEHRRTVLDFLMKHAGIETGTNNLDTQQR